MTFDRPDPTSKPIQPDADRSIVPFPGSGIPQAQKAIGFNKHRDVGRGQLPRRMRKPVIYFAGRMDGSKDGIDWRNAVEGFAGLYTVNAEFGTINCDMAVDCGAFWYSGPFAIDHTGGHSSGHTSCRKEHREIWDIDKFQIERADLILAYIDDNQAFGTLVEIGYASALGKPIALGFSERMSRQDYSELWLCRMAAAKVYWGPAEQIWREVQRDWIFS